MAICHAQPNFIDVAQTKGIDATYGFGAPGAGVSFCDFNNDGWDDLTFATESGEKLHFYVNNEGTFESINLNINHAEQSKQVLWVDFDNDGDKDLYVVTFAGINRLYRNLGDLTFTDVTTSAGLPSDTYQSFGACWGDYDRDGWLDLYYSERTGGVQMGQNRLFRNNADGTFTEMSEAANAGDPGKIPFCSAFFDFNNDKWPDLYTANDKRTGNTLLQNMGDGTFTDLGATAGADLEMDAMCVAVGDINNDGWQEIYVTNTSSGNALLYNRGADSNSITQFENTAGITGTGFHGVGWGSNFLDVDNDGFQDLYVSGISNFVDSVESTCYLNQGDGTFIEPDAGFIGDTTKSFSNAVGDINNDGYADIVVGNHAPFKNQLWQSSGGGHNWLKIDLEGVLSNRDAIGAKIEAFTGENFQMRYLHCGIGFLGQNSGTEIFGLGDRTTADSVRVTWPTGHIDRLFDVAANQQIHILEGSTTQGEIFVDPDIELTTSISEPKDISGIELSVYPNPADNVLNLYWNRYGEYTITVLRDNGVTFHSQQVSDNHISMNISEWPVGSYFVIVKNEAGRRSIRQWAKF